MKKDWTGQKFHRLTFIRPTDERKGKSVVWELRCDCGNIIHIRAIDAVRGTTTSCGCRATEIRQQLTYDPIITSARGVWRIYKEDGLDFDTFYDLSRQPCHYCGRLPYRAYNISLSKKKSGLNVNPLLKHCKRSSKGLHYQQCVPCCYLLGLVRCR